MNVLPRFPLGRCVITTGAATGIPPGDVRRALERHQIGDWGDLQGEDRQENEASLARGSRLFSVYHASNGAKFYVITEADRSATTVLLPEEY